MQVSKRKPTGASEEGPALETGLEMPDEASFTAGWSFTPAVDYPFPRGESQKAEGQSVATNNAEETSAPVSAGGGATVVSNSGTTMSYGGDNFDASSVTSDSASTHEPAARGMDRLAFELQDIKIKTMFQLVEEVKDTVSGTDKKLLFLTNRQAQKFDFANMSKLLTAMEITPRPKLLINLFWCAGRPADRHNRSVAFDKFSQLPHAFHCK
jgi:hypothetical protein